MKNIRKILVPILCLAALMTAFTLTACDAVFPEDDACEHTFGDWTVDVEPTCTVEGSMIRTCELCKESERSSIKASGHKMGDWKYDTPVTCTTDGIRSRTCSNTGCTETETEVLPSMGHSGTVFCDTCGTSLVETPTPEEVDMTKLGVVIKNLSFTGIATEWFAATDTVDVTLGDAYIALDENGALVGYGEATLAITTIEEVSATYNAIFFIENDIIYAAIEGEGSNDMYTSVNINDIEGVAELKQLLEDMANEDDDAADIPEIDSAALDVAIAELINSFFAVEKNSDGSSKIVLDDLSALKGVNTYLGTTKLSIILDTVMGDNAYTRVKKLLTMDTFYAWTVEQFLDNMEIMLGVDIIGSIASADEMITTITKGEYTTVSSFIASLEGLELPEGVTIPENFDLKALLEDEAFKQMTMMQVLETVIYGGIVLDDPATEDKNEALEAEANVKATIASIFSYIDNGTLYDVLIGLIDPELLATILPEGTTLTSELMTEMINEFITVIEEHLSLVVNVDKDGKLTNATIDFVITEEEELGVVIDYNVVLEDGKTTVSLDYADAKIDVAVEFEIIPGHTVEIDREAVERIKANITPAE